MNTATEMLTRVSRGGGLGFGISGSGETERYRHSGGNAGYSCFMVGFTKIEGGVVVLTNPDTGTPLIQELLSAISRRYGWPQMVVGAITRRSSYRRQTAHLLALSEQLYAPDPTRVDERKIVVNSWFSGINPQRWGGRHCCVTSSKFSGNTEDTK